MTHVTIGDVVREIQVGRRNPYQGVSLARPCEVSREAWLYEGGKRLLLEGDFSWTCDHVYAMLTSTVYTARKGDETIDAIPAIAQGPRAPVLTRHIRGCPQGTVAYGDDLVFAQWLTSFRSTGLVLCRGALGGSDSALIARIQWDKPIDVSCGELIVGASEYAIVMTHD